MYYGPEEPYGAPEEVLPGAERFDRRVLMRRGIALGAGIASAGSIVHFSYAQESATPAATGSAASATPAIVAATDAPADAAAPEAAPPPAAPGHTAITMAQQEAVRRESSGGAD